MVRTEAGWLTLEVAGGWALRTNLLGRFRRLRLEREAVRLLLPPVPETPEPRWLELRRVHGGERAPARIGGRPVTPEIEGDVLRFRLPPSDDRMRFELFLGPDAEF